MSEISPMGQGLITSIVAHTNCVCDVHPVDSGKCVRCCALDEIKKAWPSTYMSVLEVMLKHATS